jgi:hypothetical protein
LDANFNTFCFDPPLQKKNDEELTKHNGTKEDLEEINRPKKKGKKCLKLCTYND